ncbi:MAG: carbohydrate kinase, partial [Planctomycetota bacterium]
PSEDCVCADCADDGRCVGCDENGRALLTELAARGLIVDFVQRDPDHPTGLVTVDTTIPDHPVFTIHENTAWDALEYSPAWEQLARQAAAICFGTLAQRSQTARHTIRRMLENTSPGCLRVFDVNLRQHYYDLEVLESSLRAADYVKLNNDEVPIVAELLKLPSAPAAFVEKLAGWFTLEGVCVTRGADGCLLYHRGTFVDEPGLSVTVADTVGAGDAFTAAWIHALLEGQSPEIQAKFANRAGALTASKPGAMPPVADEYRRLVAELFVTP